MADVNLETLRRLPRHEYALPPDFVLRASVHVDGPTWDAVLEALERGAEERADLLGKLMRAERVEAAARALADSTIFPALSGYSRSAWDILYAPMADARDRLRAVLAAVLAEEGDGGR